VLSKAEADYRYLHALSSRAAMSFRPADCRSARRRVKNSALQRTLRVLTRRLTRAADCGPTEAHRRITKRKDKLMHATNGTLNQVILIGHCAAAPDMRFTPQGTAISNFALYTNSIRRDEQGIAFEERERHQIAAWGRLGAATAEHIRKGSHVRVEGRLETRQWQDQETGQSRFRTQVVATNILYLDPPPAREQHQDDIPEALLAILEARDEIIEPPSSIYEDVLALV
jgi:single-strand DNA-binding protein